jgi:hypothetical protein
MAPPGDATGIDSDGNKYKSREEMWEKEAGAFPNDKHHTVICDNLWEFQGMTFNQPSVKASRRCQVRFPLLSAAPSSLFPPTLPVQLVPLISYPHSSTSGGEKRSQWYQRAVDYWAASEASYNGVLGGHEKVSPADIRDSRAFLQKVRRGGASLYILLLFYCL